MRIVTYTPALSLALSACGGFGGADNCSELLDMVIEAEQISDDDLKDIAEAAETMAGRALANGANLEAALCEEIRSEVAGELVGREFERISDLLEETDD